MKTVKDKDGNIIQVDDDTPCHAGKNGALPIMLDEVLDADIFARIDARDTAWLADTGNRQKDVLRAERAELFTQADIQIRKHADAGIKVNEDNWRSYRQDIRDITDQPDIFNPVWPTKPPHIGKL